MKSLMNELERISDAIRRDQKKADLRLKARRQKRGDLIRELIQVHGARPADVVRATKLARSQIYAELDKK